MSLLSIQDIRLGFHGRPLFDGATLAVESRDRLGVVGPNGSGKSTLLKLLSGAAEPESGQVVRARNLRLGFLPQELAPGGDERLFESVMSCAPRRAQLELRLEALQEELEIQHDTARQMSLSGELAELHEELLELDRDFAPHHARRILLGLGFSSDEFDRPLREFSGGWRMRAALAGLLFQRPDVLLLDEPTNHLDMPSVHWLNRFLNAFRHALILVCHDREFLNRHVRRVASFEVEGLRTYPGNYDDYLEQRQQELLTLENRARRDEARRKELEAFVTRFKAKASKARQAQSKARLIEKMLENQADIPQLRKSIHLKFKPTGRVGDPVLEIAGLCHSYGDHRVLSDVNLSVRPGDRIAIVGLNGAGKTTLLKRIAEELKPQEGQVRLTSNARMSYFAQHHAEVLDQNKTVLDEVWRAANGLSQSEVRGICGAFLFSGDDVEKRIGVLSGGEKTRVALARLLANPGNLLLLDEPTNHLDTQSAEKLTDSLLTFDGTILFVSHNLDFARRLSNKVWDVRDGSVTEYHGSLADYLDHLSSIQDQLDGANGAGRSEAEAESRPGPGSQSARPAKAERIREREDLMRRRKHRARLVRSVKELEQRVEELELAKEKLEGQLADPQVYADRLRAVELGERHRGVAETLAAAMADWERHSAELDGLGEE
ncbi:MAG: ABC-F family ATP-binding cassette domain-containing protein [Planctomycetota bacterium]